MPLHALIMGVAAPPPTPSGLQTDPGHQAGDQDQRQGDERPRARSPSSGS